MTLVRIDAVLSGSPREFRGGVFFALDQQSDITSADRNLSQGSQVPPGVETVKSEPCGWGDQP